MDIMFQLSLSYDTEDRLPQNSTQNTRNMKHFWQNYIITKYCATVKPDSHFADSTTLTWKYITLLYVDASFLTKIRVCHKLQHEYWPSRKSATSSNVALYGRPCRLTTKLSSFLLSSRLSRLSPASSLSSASVTSSPVSSTPTSTGYWSTVNINTICSLHFCIQ